MVQPVAPVEKKIVPIAGMHCASCAAIITRKLKKAPGVQYVSANFASAKAEVEYDPQQTSIEQMNTLIQPLGYSLIDVKNQMGNVTGVDESVPGKEELQQLQQRVSFVLPVALLVFFIMMWDVGANLLAFVPKMPIPMLLLNTILFILASMVLFGAGQQFIQGVWRFIRYRAANMDTLIGIGTLSAYLYSSLLIFFPFVQTLLRLPEYSYFDVTIVVIGFVLLGKYLEARSKLRTGEAIRSLLELQAKTALVICDGKEVEIPIEQVQIGDVIVVKPGAKIPVDGIIKEGDSAVDESMITGESMPQDKHTGDTVIGSTINKQGRLLITAQKIGKDTMLSQIIKLVEEAQASKASIENMADTVSGIFVPVVLVIALLTLAVWLLFGTSFYGFQQALSYGLMSFIGVLVIACPCALGLATPTAIIVGVGKGAKHGILIKNADSLEKLGRINTIVFDKTGTITSGKPDVTDVVSFNKEIDEIALMSLAASLEHASQHPLALAIQKKADEKHVPVQDVQAFVEKEGFGVSGLINGIESAVRRPTQEEMSLPQIGQFMSEGKTVVVITQYNEAKGIIAISDTLKPAIASTIQRLRKMSVTPYLVTGDNQQSAEFIAKQAGIDHVIAGVLPQDKAEEIKKLQQQGRIVAMAGDGINDAPALTRADIGIAMATGTDVAIESADITLLHGDIRKIPQSIHLARATFRTIKMNLFWAFFYNMIGIPLASGILYPFFGIFLSPLFAGLAMAFSSVSVVTNSLLLRQTRMG